MSSYLVIVPRQGWPAIEYRLAGFEDGRDVPAASDIEALRTNPDFADAIWAIVSADYTRKSAA